MARLYLSALHKSSGKTVLTAGLAAAMRKRGRCVRTFKKGPDYIDPMWLGEASGQACINLDYHTMTAPQILGALRAGSRSADLTLIEGNKGLHDGVAVDGSNSNAALAKLTRSPVILVVDTQGMTRSIAPLINGFIDFDREVEIAGIILNQVGGPRHESKLRAAIETYCEPPVLGAVSRHADATVDERHLGLTPTMEHEQAAELLGRWRQLAEDGLDLDGIERIASTAPEPSPVAGPAPSAAPVSAPQVTIAIARCEAFAFYYPDDIDHLQNAGARIVTFDPLRDSNLPDADALFIGGGFPELHLEALEANKSLRQTIRAKVSNGMPVYAECGGLMYLADRIEFAGQRRTMVGALTGHVRMHEKPQGRGYVQLRRAASHPWPASRQAGAQDPVIAAHEFHHSSIEGLPADAAFAFEVLRGTGVNGRQDGLVRHNLLASYSHRRDIDGTGWTREFVDFVIERTRTRRTSATLTQEAVGC